MQRGGDQLPIIFFLFVFHPGRRVPGLRGMFTRPFATALTFDHEAVCVNIPAESQAMVNVPPFRQETFVPKLI